MVEVNGQQYQHATSKFILTVNGVAPVVLPLKTIKKIDASVEAPKEATYDAQGQVDGFVVRPQKNDASFSLKLAEWFALRSFLQVAPGGVLTAQFTFTVTFGNAVNALHTLDLVGCMVQREAFSSDDSQDPDMMEVPLFFTKLLVDRISPIIYEP